MASRLPDFSHLTADERIELAEQLWNSLPVDSIDPDDLQAAELRRRRARLEMGGDTDLPWSEALDKISGNGG